MKYHELRYWENVLEKGSYPRYDINNLKENLCWLVGRDYGLVILDVGCGPLPYLRELIHSNIIIGIDVLANEYHGLIKQYGLSHAVPILPIQAEVLSQFFREHTFDFITCNNALDHMETPFDAFCAMLSLVKRGGAIQLSFAENEADRRDHEGFHQWNLTWDSTTLTLSIKSISEKSIPIQDFGLSLKSSVVDQEYVTLYLKKDA